MTKTNPDTAHYAVRICTCSCGREFSRPHLLKRHTDAAEKRARRAYYEAITVRDAKGGE